MCKEYNRGQNTPHPRERRLQPTSPNRFYPLRYTYLVEHSYRNDCQRNRFDGDAYCVETELTNGEKHKISILDILEKYSPSEGRGGICVRNFVATFSDYSLYRLVLAPYILKSL